jgi:hypothetical protein
MVVVVRMLLRVAVPSRMSDVAKMQRVVCVGQTASAANAATPRLNQL